MKHEKHCMLNKKTWNVHCEYIKPFAGNSNAKNQKKKKSIENKQTTFSFCFSCQKEFLCKIDSLSWIFGQNVSFSPRSFFILSLHLQSFQTVFQIPFQLISFDRISSSFNFFFCTCCWCFCCCSSHQRKKENKNAKWKLCQKLQVEQASGRIVFPNTFLFLRCRSDILLGMISHEHNWTISRITKRCASFQIRQKDNPPFFSLPLSFVLLPDSRFESGWSAVMCRFNKPKNQITGSTKVTVTTASITQGCPSNETKALVFLAYIFFLFLAQTAPCCPWFGIMLHICDDISALCIFVPFSINIPRLNSTRATAQFFRIEIMIGL